MLTNDMPQCYHIVMARGRQREGCRLQAASAVVKESEGFNDMSANEATRVGSSFRLRAVSGEQPLRTRTADTIETGGIRQRGLVMTIVLWRHHCCDDSLGLPRCLYNILLLPIQMICQKGCCQ